MKILCNKSILHEYLDIVSKAVSTRTTLPILECILLEAKDGVFTLKANNLEISIDSKSMPCEIKEDGAIAIEAKLFSDIIRKLPEGEVLIDVDENMLVKIKCFKSEYKILGQSPGDFPLVPLFDVNESYKIKQKDFKNLIKYTNFSVSLDESKPVFTGELLEIAENEISLVSIDGYRISFAKTASEKNDVTKNVIIPGKTINELGKLINPKDEEGEFSLSIGDNHVSFEFSNFRLVSRVIDGQFLNYEQSFSSDYTSKVCVNRNDFLNAIDRVAIISKDGRKNPVRIVLRDNVMELRSKTEMGTAFEEILINLDGKELEIGFNPKYLTDPLKAIEDDEIVLLFNTAISPCIIYNEENSSYKYLVLPLKL